MKQWTRVRQKVLREKRSKRSVMREEGPPWAGTVRTNGSILRLGSATETAWMMGFSQTDNFSREFRQ